MRDKTSRSFCLKTPTLKTSLTSLRWALASLRLGIFLHPTAVCTAYCYNSFFTNPALLAEKPQNRQEFSYLTLVAGAEQKLLGVYLRLAFNFFQTLSQTQFALFFKIQKGSNRKKTAHRPVNTNQASPKPTPSAANPSFKATKVHVSLYWKARYSLQHTKQTAKLLRYKTVLPVTTLLQHVVNLNQVLSTKTLLQLTQPQQSNSSKLKLAAASIYTMRRQHLQTLKSRDLLDRLLTTPQSPVKWPIPPVTTFLEKESQLYVNKELPIWELTAELKTLYPAHKPPHKALQRLRKILQFRQVSQQKQAESRTKVNCAVETSSRVFVEILNKNRYFYALSAHFRHQQLFNKLTPDLSDRRVQQQITNRAVIATPELMQKPYTPTNLKIVKVLRLLSAKRHKQFMLLQPYLASWGFPNSASKKLSWNPLLLLKQALKRTTIVQQAVKHIGKVSTRHAAAALESPSISMFKKHHSNLPTPSQLQFAAKKFKQQTANIVKNLQIPPKSPEVQAQEHKELLALKKTAYFKQLAFLKAQGPVKHGQLVKPEKTPKQPLLGSKSSSLPRKTKKPRKKLTTSRVMWLLKLKKYKLQFLLKNEFKTDYEQAQQASWERKLVNIAPIYGNPEEELTTNSTHTPPIAAALPPVFNYLQTRPYRKGPKLQPFVEKFTAQSLLQINLMTKAIRPLKISKLHTPFKTYQALTIQAKSFTHHLETALGLLKNITKTSRKIFTSKFMRFQHPELIMFSPNIKSIRKRKTPQHFSGLALKDFFRWSAGSPKKILMSLKVLKKTATSQESKRLVEHEHNPLFLASRHLLAAEITSKINHDQPTQPKPGMAANTSTALSLTNTDQYLQASLQKRADWVSADLRAATPFLFIRTVWTRLQMKLQQTRFAKAAEHRQRYRPKSTKRRFITALILQPKLDWQNGRVVDSFQTPYKRLSKKQRQLLQHVSSKQTLNTFFKARHKPINFAKPWLLDSAIPAYTKARRARVKTRPSRSGRKPPQLITPPALLEAIKAKQRNLTIAHPYIATNWMPHKKLQRRKAWTPQILSLFVFLSRNPLILKNNKVWEQHVGFRVANRFWPQSKKPKSKTFSQAKYAALKQNFRKLAKAVAVLRLKTYPNLKAPTGVLKKAPSLRRAPLHPASRKNIRVQSNPVQRLSTTRTYDMFKRFIFTFWRAQALFKAKFTPQKHWNRWKFKHKFWAWFKKQKTMRRQHVNNQIAFPALWLLLVQLKWAVTKTQALKLMTFDFFLHNGKKLTSLETPLAVGDIIQGPLSANKILQKARVKELTTAKNYVKKYKRVQYVIKRSQWRKRRTKQKDVYTSLVHRVPNSVPSWLQVDLFSNSFAVISAPTQFVQLGVMPQEGYTLQKLTPWRLKI